MAPIKAKHSTRVLNRYKQSNASFSLGSTNQVEAVVEGMPEVEEAEEAMQEEADEVVGEVVL